MKKFYLSHKSLLHSPAFYYTCLFFLVVWTAFNNPLPEYTLPIKICAFICTFVTMAILFSVIKKLYNKLKQSKLSEFLRENYRQFKEIFDDLISDKDI